MTRLLYGRWQYTTQTMDFVHIEAFLARLILKRGRLFVSICDKQEHPVAAARFTASDIYTLDKDMHVAGLVLYQTYYRVKIDSFKNVSLVPIF